MNTHEVLVRARNRISDEKDWAESPDRIDYMLTGPICAVLAISWACDDSEEGADVALRSAIGSDDIVRFNDTHSHAEVLAAFDKAIQATAPEPDTSFLAEVEEAIPA